MRRGILFSFAIWLFLAGLLALSCAARADPELWRSEGWNTEFSKHSVAWSEITSGGPPKDGIPSIDEPRFLPLSAVRDLDPREPVIGLEVGRDAKAYPLRVLIWHEIVNDEIGGIPVIVTYCPLCNTAIVFDRRVAGRTLSFGTTGKLRHSDLIMYDRQTESWWQQFTGEAIAGTYTGIELALVPSRLESFAQFKERRPNGMVLVPNNPGQRDYGRNPYVGYDTAARPFLFAGALPEGINPMARVVVVGKSEKPRAVALDLLRRKRTMTVDDVILSWREGQASALDTSKVAKGRDVGTVTAQRKGPDGTMLDVPYKVTFAFSFHAFHPDEPILH